MNVYVCVTLYHVYNTLLHIFSETEKGNNIVLLNANNEHVYESYKYIAEQLSKYGITCDLRLRTRIGEFTGKERKRNKEQLNFIREEMKKHGDSTLRLFNFAWNNSYVYSTVGLLYRECDEVIFIEESVNIGKLSQEKQWKKILHKITGDKVDFYADDKLTEIRAQKPENFPNEWQNKITQLDIQKLVAVLSDDNKNAIMDIMSKEGKQAASLLNKKNVGIVYSVPLSEEKIVSEEEKIGYFAKLCNLYKQYGTVVFKPHPRDTSVYPFADDVQILPASFPSELLSLAGTEFEFAVSICSSAVFTTNAKVKLNMNENFLDDHVFLLKDIDGNIVEG